ncbi:MAG: S8 family peptidase [Candidatus Eisenbacteria bacterium]|nr:S8 family peptidase [Candidatus Eisenbacteria bacterium]
MPSKPDDGSLDRLPIKLILPTQGNERVVPGGGPRATPFREVTPEYRSRLRHQVDAIKAVAAATPSGLGVPMRVKLLEKSVAKSHRPHHLFSASTCPIIGAGMLGELFVKGTPRGLQELASLIEAHHSAQMIKELSSVEVIEPVTPILRRGGVAPLDILRKSPRRRKGFVTRVRLFDYASDQEQSRVEADFLAACAKRGIPTSQEGYAPGSYVYSAECASSDDVDALSRVVGVRSLARMPLVRAVRPRVIRPAGLPQDLPSVQGLSGDFPVVVVVDSGVSTALPALREWIVGARTDVAEPYRNPEHGTFVAGLVCWGGHLNPGLPGIGASPCGIFDLQVIPNYDPAKGATDDLLESEFLQSLEAALREHANKYKVWNLSLGTDEVCSLDEFSAFAEQLDNLQEKYQVVFVISAGNYDTPPLLDYPRTPGQLRAGRITSPADSVLGVTVGSVAQVDTSPGQTSNHPSTFSRHGAGPNHVIKPDLVHYGGACSTDLNHTAGVRSIVGTTTAEDVGTSFATPLVSRSLAQVFHQITPSPSPVLARALLTHHARDPRNGGRVPDGEENYFGFGLPQPPPYCLQCSPSSSTLVFEDTLRPGYFLEWDDFPYPPSLARQGRFFGEIWMTVAFAPARGARWGTEYCETHIDAHFGVFYEQRERKTGQVTRKFRGLVPPEHKNPGVLYESYQVERLRKWAPVRTYHGQLGDGGERGDRWRLMVRLLTRHGVEDAEAFKPQAFALVVTIADPLGQAPVYDEMARSIRTRFSAQNLTVRAAPRVRARV